jgi:hypothetical protein
MGTNQAKHGLSAFIAVAVIWILAGAPLAGQRWWHQGDTWLKWNHNERDAFLFGYMVGYSNGHTDGCSHGINPKSGETKPEYESGALSECTKQQIDFSKGTDFSKLLTDFYNRYPKDRELGIDEVLDLLAKGLTLEQIHNHSFPRRPAPNAEP